MEMLQNYGLPKNEDTKLKKRKRKPKYTISNKNTRIYNYITYPVR